MEPFATVDIDGTAYQISRLSPKKAFHVARRLAPFLGAILPHIGQLFVKEEDGSVPKAAAFLERGKDVFPAIADVLAKMDDADCDYILDTCLAVVAVRQERGFVAVMSNGVMMFDNIDMKTMLLLAAEVVKLNLADFFPSNQPESAPEMVTQ